MKYTPRISIITSVYNGEKYLEDCIKSIIGQSYPDVESIIIDGGSTDGTTRIIRQYQEKLHYWVSEKDKGIYEAWNKGLAHATGEWIAFVGSDDILWDPYVVENALPQLYAARELGIRFVYGKINLLSAGSEILSVRGEPWEKAEKDILKHMTVTHCGAFHHRSMFQELGNFDERFRIIGDYEFLLREFTKGRQALFADRLFAGMHAGGISANLGSKLPMARELLLAKALNHIPPSFHDQLQMIKARIASMLISMVGAKTVARWSDHYRVLKGKEKVWSRID